MGQAWMVASGKGGAGKTIVTASLGIALAKRNLRCAVVDADIGLRNLDLLLGLESKVVFDVLDVAQRECTLKSALIPDARHPLLSLLPASQMGKPEELTGDSLAWVVGKLKKRFSYILMDAPAGLSGSIDALIQCTEQTLLVITPDDAAIRDAERFISLLETQHKPRPLLIVNRVYPDLVRRGEMYSPQTVANVLDTPLLGFIPNDLQILRSQGRRQSFMDVNCPAGRAMERICSRFLGESVPMPNLEKKRRLISRDKEEVSPL